MARINQLFEDGNHRTAVLSIYEKLADAGWLLTADPFSIYIAISNREHWETSAVEANLNRRIARHAVWNPSVSLAERAAFAADAKQIAAVNSLFEHAHSWLTSMRVPRGERTSIVPAGNNGGPSADCQGTAMLSMSAFMEFQIYDFYLRNQSMHLSASRSLLQLVLVGPGSI